ncbi:hypothetical protein [Streptosporangium lutulentum]|uniref:Uncharacterized protein n=1 Tax=Streptosporangium lutulentum TaxID=1461250 RepID=A0ABT9Q9A6_9ACTN|nr:hypothetical protein [Streptosporangium lutulentum]MDP9843316.1 hypothetical protein [Streptosporangium lutulentum]
MTALASTIASNKLPYDRKLAIVAMRAARHYTCPAFAPLRGLLVDLLQEDGHAPVHADEHADNLINAALGVMASIEADEPRTVPWRGGPDIGEYAEAMYRLERGL